MHNGYNQKETGPINLELPTRDMASVFHGKDSFSALQVEWWREWRMAVKSVQHRTAVVNVPLPLNMPSHSNKCNTLNLHLEWSNRQYLKLYSQCKCYTKEYFMNPAVSLFLHY